VSGHVIACFGDPGLLAARELADKPVVGIAEAAMHMATLVATRFSIVTTLPRTLVIARHLLHQYGFERHCAARCMRLSLPVLRWRTAAVGLSKKCVSSASGLSNRMAAGRLCLAAAAWPIWRAN
jgi:allantoin racemase